MQYDCKVHCSLFTICGDGCPFHASMLRPASQAGPMHETAGVGKLVNAVLLSLINVACVNVCCATLFSSELVGPACVQARSSNPRGRACRPSGKGSGRRGYWVTLYLYIYTARLLVSVFL